ncbi:hypothetical protein D9758_001985 [Tetrapyrgos nigripes]|uniref:Uncharacterized protein n=1 Tax=Tetrapyrgos nigripes TaxID=182062 RepID=A0A8H5LVB8_9AGAR|nr:hypothetical protein D9758_001985 [Tetrapyrgos nigripes]
MSDSEDESTKIPFGGHGGSTKPRQKRSFTPTSDDGEIVVPAQDDSDSPAPPEKPPEKPPEQPLIRQSLAFSSEFSSNSSHEINTYQSSATAPSGSKKKAFLPGQRVELTTKPKKNKPKRERPKASYAGNTGRFRLKDYVPTTVEHAPAPPSGSTSTLNAFQAFETANSPAPTTPSLSSENGTGRRSTPSDLSEIGNTASEGYANPRHSLSELLGRPNSQTATSAPTNPATHILSSVPPPRNPPIVTPVAPSPLSSHAHMNVVSHKSSYYRRDYDKQYDLTITEPISHDQRTQSAPLSLQHRVDRENHQDFSMHSASPPPTTSLSSPRIAQSSHVASLSPTTTQFPSPPPSSSATIHTTESSAHASPLQTEFNPQFRHHSLPSPPLQARPQFRSPPSQPPQFRPTQFDEQSSQSSHSHSPANDVQSRPRSPQMDVDPHPESRYPQEESFGSARTGTGSSALGQHRSVHANQQGRNYHSHPPSEARALYKPENDHLAREPVSPYKSGRMVTLLITDFRSRTEDHQLAEIVIPLRAVEPDTAEGGFWASAHDIADALQSSPSRIESPGRAYTMRGKWKQFFLRVVDGRNEVSSSANLLITPERTLDIGVIGIAPSELPSHAYGRPPVPEHAHPNRSNMNNRQHEAQYAMDPSRKRQRSPSEGGRERRPFSSSQ